MKIPLFTKKAVAGVPCSTNLADFILPEFTPEEAGAVLGTIRDAYAQQMVVTVANNPDHFAVPGSPIPGLDARFKTDPRLGITEPTLYGDDVASKQAFVGLLQTYANPASAPVVKHRVGQRLHAATLAGVWTEVDQQLRAIDPNAGLGVIPLAAKPTRISDLLTPQDQVRLERQQQAGQVLGTIAGKVAKVFNTPIPVPQWGVTPTTKMPPPPPIPEPPVYPANNTVTAVTPFTQPPQR
jgi:hypothetical protein